MVGRPEKFCEVVLDSDGHRMVDRKGVSEQVGHVNGRHVLQSEAFPYMKVSASCKILEPRYVFKVIYFF